MTVSLIDSQLSCYLFHAFEKMDAVITSRSRQIILQSSVKIEEVRNIYVIYTNGRNNDCQTLLRSMHRRRINVATIFTGSQSMPRKIYLLSRIASLYPLSSHAIPIASPSSFRVSTKPCTSLPLLLDTFIGPIKDLSRSCVFLLFRCTFLRRSLRTLDYEKHPRNLGKLLHVVTRGIYRDSRFYSYS